MTGERDLADGLAGEDRRATIANILRVEKETLDEGNNPQLGTVLDSKGKPATQAEMDEIMARRWLKIEEEHRLEDGV